MRIEPAKRADWPDIRRIYIAGIRTGHATFQTIDDVPDGEGNGVCGTLNESGWAGTQSAWATSSFSAVALDSASLAGQPVRIDIRYGTDAAANGSGFRFDQLTLTDLLDEVADAQSDVCSGPIFSDGFESGNTSLWSSTVGAAP